MSDQTVSYPATKKTFNLNISGLKADGSNGRVASGVITATSSNPSVIGSVTQSPSNPLVFVATATGNAGDSTITFRNSVSGATGNVVIEIYDPSLEATTLAVSVTTD